jgi:titin
VVTGVVYTYRVRAVNSSNSLFPAGYSNEATATLGALTAPTGLTAAAITSRRVQLRWTDSSTAETGFYIERAKLELRADGSALPLVFRQISQVAGNTTGVVDGTIPDPLATYFYRIRAFNGSGVSSYSNQAGGVIPLPAPTNLSARPETYAIPNNPVPGTGVRLTWTDNSPSESGFAIERKLAGEASFVEIGSVGTNGTSFFDPTFDTRYIYRVRAKGERTDRSLPTNEVAVAG